MIGMIICFGCGIIGGMWAKNQINEGKNPFNTIGQSTIIAKNKLIEFGKYTNKKIKKTKNIKSVDEGPNIGVGS